MVWQFVACAICIHWTECCSTGTVSFVYRGKVVGEEEMQILETAWLFDIWLCVIWIEEWSGFEGKRDYVNYEYE